MTPREKLITAFQSVATGTLRLDPESAATFATHIANANQAIHVIGQLCTSPNALSSDTLAAMLDRWFRLLPEYEMPRLVLARKPEQGLSAPDLDAATSLMLHTRVMEVCISQRKYSESLALQVATHIRKAAPGFFALEQKCRAPDRHTQRVLLATLRGALSLPFQHASEAASLYLGANET